VLGVGIAAKAGNFSVHYHVRTGSETHVITYLTVPGVLSLWVKQQEREADHSPPSCAKVKNAWSYNSIPQYAFMAWCSVKAQGQLYRLVNNKIFQFVT